MLLLDSDQNSLNPKLAHRFDLNRPDFKPCGFTCELWKAAPMRRPDRHNEIELNLLKKGSLTYLLGGERVTLEEGRLGAFWAALPHQIIGSEDFRTSSRFYEAFERACGSSPSRYRKDHRLGE